MEDLDVIVVGGGMIGSAIAYGLAGLGQRTAVVDESDRAFRAARGNFGLVWVQGKGQGAPAYSSWTRASAEAWPLLHDTLMDETGVDSGYRRPGGLHICQTEAEIEQRARKLSQLAAETKGGFSYEMLDHSALRRMLPEIGPTVAGASFSDWDGHANPLFLLRALKAGFARFGGRHLEGRVTTIAPAADGYNVHLEEGLRATAGKVVIAAGLGSGPLSRQLGIEMPVRPERGQVLVTERVNRFLDLPTIHIRQTFEGSLLLGDSHEDVGFDDGVDRNILGQIAARAVRTFPVLEHTRVIRSWGALRVMSPDGLPLYDQSPAHPGVFTASAHSGVTLAAIHASAFARGVLEGRLPNELTFLSARRFHA